MRPVGAIHQVPLPYCLWWKLFGQPIIVGVKLLQTMQLKTFATHFILSGTIVSVVTFLEFAKGRAYLPPLWQPFPYHDGAHLCPCL